MVNVPDTRGNGRYQLKPLAEPELYVAVVNGQLALKVSITYFGSFTSAKQT